MGVEPKAIGTCIPPDRLVTGVEPKANWDLYPTRSSGDGNRTQKQLGPEEFAELKEAWKNER
jgi:hypothetical protein